MDVAFAAGEEMRTEISCKFTREAVEEMYADAGLRLVEWHEDPRGLVRGLGGAPRRADPSAVARDGGPRARCRSRGA